MCSPMTKVTFRFVVERNGTKPLIPDKDLTSKNLTLLNDMVLPCEIYLAPDGQLEKSYRIEGVLRIRPRRMEEMYNNRRPSPKCPGRTSSSATTRS